jgi:hypothetical protein
MVHCIRCAWAHLYILIYIYIYIYIYICILAVYLYSNVYILAVCILLYAWVHYIRCARLHGRPHGCTLGHCILCTWANGRIYIRCIHTLIRCIYTLLYMGSLYALHMGARAHSYTMCISPYTLYIYSYTLYTYSYTYGFTVFSAHGRMGVFIYAVSIPLYAVYILLYTWVHYMREPMHMGAWAHLYTLYTNIRIYIRCILINAFIYAVY